MDAIIWAWFKNLQLLFLLCAAFPPSTAVLKLSYTTWQR